MSAEVVPFPSNRRRHFVDGVAKRVAAMDPSSAEIEISRVVNMTRKRLARAGIDPELAARDVSRLEWAIWNRSAELYLGGNESTPGGNASR